MQQTVIYLRRTDSSLVQQDSFTLEKTTHNFEVIRLWEQPTELFLTSPGLFPLAVLSCTDDPTAILIQVATQIESISQPQLQSNLAASTAILAGLVLNKQVISRILRREIMRESSLLSRTG